jgi:N-glycosylase/DNA lyase
MADQIKPEITLVTLDPEEFNDVVKRVHSFLLSRAERAKEKKELKPSNKTQSNHVEAAKDVFVFVHMMELIEQMSEEISDLRDILSAMGGGPEEKSVVSSFDMFSSNKKHFVN